MLYEISYCYYQNSKRRHYLTIILLQTVHGFHSQNVGRDFSKMFSEDLFKLDTSVVPATIR